MLDVNMIIANNIQAELKKENKKQVDLAKGIGVSKQTMSKIMNTSKRSRGSKMPPRLLSNHSVNIQPFTHTRPAFVGAG